MERKKFVDKILREYTPLIRRGFGNYTITGSLSDENCLEITLRSGVITPPWDRAKIYTLLVGGLAGRKYNGKPIYVSVSHKQFEP